MIIIKSTTKQILKRLSEKSKLILQKNKKTKKQKNCECMQWYGSMVMVVPRQETEKRVSNC